MLPTVLHQALSHVWSPCQRLSQGSESCQHNKADGPVQPSPHCVILSIYVCRRQHRQVSKRMASTPRQPQGLPCSLVRPYPSRGKSSQRLHSRTGTPKQTSPYLPGSASPMLPSPAVSPLAYIKHALLQADRVERFSSHMLPSIPCDSPAW